MATNAQGKRKHIGELSVIDEDSITLSCQGQEVFVPLDHVAKIRLVPVS